ncbi:MAG TPA: DUF5706 domain-containing protein [Pseudobdellovibrionaceae bacterium]|nr:DUF5706 domain-containing protein [Pseudobdellovibrionaceae bacterium]
MDDIRKTDLAFKLLDNVQNLIKFADTKVNVLLIISGVTTTFVISNFSKISETSILGQISLALFIISFIVFTIFALMTISPRSDKHTGKSVAKTIYFKHIAERVEVKDFIEDYSKLDEKNFQADLLYQIFENSKIAEKKFYFYNLCLTALKVQIVIFLTILGINIL